MIRVFIADDHQLLRRGIAELLIESGGMVVAGEAGDAQGVLEGLPKAEADVLLMDFSMPGRSGFDLIRDVKVSHPRLPILLLSMHPIDRFALRAMRAGAAGYLTKDTDPDELVNAIRKVSRGMKYLSPAVAERMAVDFDANKPALPHEALSDREFQVFCMLAGGKKVKQIANELHLSFRTINTFRARILRKLDLKSTVALTHYALEHKLID